MLDVRNMNIDNTKVYALVRVSSDKQDFDSQMQGISNWCRNNSIELLEQNIIEAYNVSGFKTKMKNRNDLKQIEQLALDNKIKMLICFNQDRIGRRTELISFFNKLTENNVLIVSVTEGILNDTSNSAYDLISMVKFWTAKEESKKISQRTKSGKLATSKANGYNGGKVLLGYKVINGKLVVDESMRNIIARVFELYISDGTNACINYLKSVGIRKTTQTIMQLLRNSTYKGYIQHDRKLYEAKDYEEITQFNEELQIVSEDIWTRANELIQSRRTNLKGSKVKTNRTDIKLESLCVCAHCQSKLTLQKDYRYEPTRYILQCRRCKTNKEVHQKNWSYNKVEEIVDSKLDEILNYEIDRDKLEKRYNSRRNIDINELEQLLELKQQELKNKTRAISNANKKLELLLSSDTDNMDNLKIITDTINKFRAEAEELEQDIQQLEQQIEQQRLSNANDNKKLEILLQVKELYHKANKQQQKQLIQMLVKKIEVSNDREYNVKIYLNY